MNVVIAKSESMVTEYCSHFHDWRCLFIRCSSVCWCSFEVVFVFKFNSHSLKAKCLRTHSNVCLSYRKLWWQLAGFVARRRRWWQRTCSWPCRSSWPGGSTDFRRPTESSSSPRSSRRSSTSDWLGLRDFLSADGIGARLGFPVQSVANTEECRIPCADLEISFKTYLVL